MKRREALKILAASGFSLPVWQKPVVEVGRLPAFVFISGAHTISLTNLRLHVSEHDCTIAPDVISPDETLGRIGGILFNYHDPAGQIGRGTTVFFETDANTTIPTQFTIGEDVILFFGGDSVQGLIAIPVCIHFGPVESFYLRIQFQNRLGHTSNILEGTISRPPDVPRGNRVSTLSLLDADSVDPALIDEALVPQ